MRSPGVASPPVWHSSEIRGDFAGCEAIAAALEVVARELTPLATTFFTVDEYGEIEAEFAHASRLPAAQLVEEVSGWEARLRGVDPLAPAKIARLPRRIVTSRHNIYESYSRVGYTQGPNGGPVGGAALLLAMVG